jgi:undecaprenyl-diphosphatase
MRPLPSVALLTLGIAGVAGYAMTARAVSQRRVSADDRMVRDKVQESRESEGESVAEVVGPIGKEWLHIPIAAVLGAYLIRRDTRRVRAMMPLAASVTSELASRVFDRLPPNRTPPPGHPDPNNPSFPSGHANETTAVAFTSAYVLAREGMVAAPPAFAIATILSIASPASRMYLDRHWISDVCGGWCLGLTIFAAYAAMYESTRVTD